MTQNVGSLLGLRDRKIDNMCVCVRERERERERKRKIENVCGYVCKRKRKRNIESGKERERGENTR
jgi:hypothetical protein